MQTRDILKIHPPAGATAPLVLDSPHSGHDFPHDFGAAVSIELLRDAEDVDVHELYAHAPRHGAHLLEALFPRSYIDPNRSVGDIDLDLIDGPWPDDYLPSGKARLGKALVWRNLDDGTPIYAARLPVETVRHRIRHYLRPYQDALKTLIEQAHQVHGAVYHINCHSMEAVGGPMAEGGAGRVRADIVLGDRDGSTCEPGFTARVAEFFSARGYSVAINDPFKGVELVRMFSDPAAGRHSLQIELNKRLYLRAGTRERGERFDELQAHLGDLVAELAHYANRQAAS